jgi:alpha-beta hydrolase superfamily lysophospholipase
MTSDLESDTSMPMLDLPPIRKWYVKDAIGAVHIIHGLAEHPERYDELADALNAARFTAWAHHQRGHGDNPLPGILGHFADHDGWRLLMDDAWAVSNQLKNETGLPLVMLAHSMGSFVGQGVLAEHGAAYQAVIFTGTNGPPSLIEHQGRVVAEWQLQVLGPRNPGLWLFHIVFDTFNAAFGLNVPPNTWLSRDALEVEKYNNDKKCGFPLTSKAWLDLADGRLGQASLEFFQKYPRDLPIHIMAGTADPVGERSAGVRRLLDVMAKAGLTNVSGQLYDDARHELVHETNRQDVMRDIVAWLLTHRTPSNFQPRR